MGVRVATGPTENSAVVEALLVVSGSQPARTCRCRRGAVAAAGAGRIYRSEIFYTGEEQRRVAAETIADVDASGHWPGKVVAEISEAGRFLEAEAEDQNYLQRYPGGCAPPFPRHGVEAAHRKTAA
jgi:hypothetical protein